MLSQSNSAAQGLFSKKKSDLAVGEIDAPGRQGR
jgi:hypothetical protein